MEPEYLYIALSLIGVIVFLFILWIISGKKKSQKIEEIAYSMGFLFKPHIDPDSDDWFHGYPGIPGFGHTIPLIENVMRGYIESFTVTIYDYREGGHRGINEYTAIVFHSDRPNLPSFRLTPKSIFDRMSGTSSFYYIQFDAFKKFSKNYALWTEYEDQTRSVFTTDVLNYLENNRGWHIESIEKKGVYIYKGEIKIAPKERPEFLNKEGKIISLFH